MKNKFLKNQYIWIAFLIALLPRLVFLMATYPVSIGGDEMFAMWPAAKILGYDWSGIMQEYRYYGYGYSILLLPFMALIKEPVILYRCMVGMMALCQALAAPISFHLMKKYFHMKDEKVICLISIICSYLVAVRATYTYPEFVYVLVVWFIVWTVLKLNTVNECKRKKLIYTIILFALLTYAYTVHSRAVALWMALAGLVVLYMWIYRKLYLSLSACVMVGIPFFLMVSVGIDKVLSFLGTAQAGNVSNTSAMLPVSILEIFKNPKSWTAWADIIIGQLNESVIFTGGIAVAIVVALLLLIWRGLCRETKIICENEKEYVPYIVVGIYSICAIGVTIGGQSLSWLGGVTAFLEGGGNDDALRAITYLRYYGAYIGPLFMTGAVYILQHPKIVKKIKGKVAVLTGLLQGYWVLVIIPVVCYSTGCIWSYAPYSLTKGFAAEGIGIRSYLPGTVFVFLFLAISYWLFKKKRIKILLGLLCVILIYTYAFNGVFHERYRGEKNYNYTKAVVDWIADVETGGSEIDQIYTNHDLVPGTGQGTKFQFQFLMPEKRVICGIPEGREGDIYISYSSDEEVERELKGNYKKIQITEEAVAYVWEKELR